MQDAVQSKFGLHASTFANSRVLLIGLFLRVLSTLCLLLSDLWQHFFLSSLFDYLSYISSSKGLLCIFDCILHENRFYMLMKLFFCWREGGFWYIFNYRF